jgi:hypothetical protein
MKDFIISCNIEDIEYELKAQDITEARHWVINHLDLSKDWTV